MLKNMKHRVTTDRAEGNTVAILMLIGASIIITTGLYLTLIRPTNDQGVQVENCINNNHQITSGTNVNRC